MCEMLVRTQDNVLPDAIENLKSWKRGMVITVQEDGWVWGNEELNNPVFAIIKAPGMTVSEGSIFLGNLIDPRAAVPDTKNPLRQFSVNLEDVSIKSLVTDVGAKTRPIEAISLTKPQVTALKTVVSISNPLVVG